MADEHDNEILNIKTTPTDTVKIFILFLYLIYFSYIRMIFIKNFHARWQFLLKMLLNSAESKSFISIQLLKSFKIL